MLLWWESYQRMPNNGEMIIIMKQYFLKASKAFVIVLVRLL